MGKTKIVGYIRVSSGQQAEEGLSLEVQRLKLEAYAQAMDLELVCIYADEGVSAKNLAGRPGILSALAMLDSGEAQGLLVAKLDRLTRSVRDLGTLVEEYFTKNCSLLSIGDSIDTRSASGRLLLNVLTSVAQWEREACSERTKDALALLKAQGKCVGKPPYGYSAGDEGFLVPHEQEQEVIREIRAMRAKGMTQLAIVGALAEAGYVSRVGKPLGMTQVARVTQAA